MLTAPGCSFLLKGGDPDFSKEWQGCYRGGEPRTGLILEAVLDDDGETTRMLTGCLVLGLGTPTPQMATVSGIADSDEEIEVSDGTALYQLSRDDQGTDTRIDDTVTVFSRGQTVGPIPECNLEQSPTCDELFSGGVL